MKEVEWVAADIFSPSDWSEKCKVVTDTSVELKEIYLVLITLNADIIFFVGLQDADSVCVAVGAFGTNATMKVGSISYLTNYLNVYSRLGKIHFPDI
tara:strand:- start:2189 stop:2479 length:291 start_codon:yes stop_codon:yes gene_type:complete